MGALTESRWLAAAGAGDLDELRRVPILTVARDLGLQLRNRSCRCPLPGHEDRTPSFYVKAATNTWRCFAWGGHGSVIDLVAQVCGWDFRRAAAWMRGRYLFGGPASAVRRPSPRGGDAALSFRPDPEVYEWVLERCPLGAEAIGYFAGRAITEVTLRAFRACQMANPAALAKEAAERFGHMRVKAAGLLTRRSTPGRPVCVFPQASAVFPFLRGGGANTSRRGPSAGAPSGGSTCRASIPLRSTRTSSTTLRPSTWCCARGYQIRCRRRSLAGGRWGFSAPVRGSPIRTPASSAGGTSTWSPTATPRAVGWESGFMASWSARGRIRSSRGCEGCGDLNEYLVGLRGRG